MEMPEFEGSVPDQLDAVLERDPWMHWRPMLAQNPWRCWIPGVALPVIEEEVQLGQDPEDPEFEWVECEDLLECTVQDDESEAGSEIYFSGGVLEEVPFPAVPEPIEKIQILFRGFGGLGVWKVGLGETLGKWHERVGLSGGDSGQDGYYTTIGGRMLDPKVPIGRLGIQDGMEVVYQVRLRGGGYGGGGGTPRDGGAGRKDAGAGGLVAQAGVGTAMGRLVGPTGRNQVHVPGGDPTYPVNQARSSGVGGKGLGGGGVKGNVTPVGAGKADAVAGAPLPVGW